MQLIHLSNAVKYDKNIEIRGG